MRTTPVAPLLLLAACLAFGPKPVAKASSPGGDGQMVLVNIRPVGEGGQDEPILMMARDTLVMDQVNKNAVLPHRIYLLGGDKFTAVESFWKNETEGCCAPGPPPCGELSEHGSFEIIERAMNGVRGFDFVLPSKPSVESLRKFERFVEDRRISAGLAADLKAMLADL
jgi:hypothetical protein